MKEFLNRGLNFARKLTEQLCRKINERLFTEEKIEALIVDSLITHFEAGGDLEPDVKIEYNLVEEYTAEELELIESKEKGATSTGEPLATATMYDEKHYFIEFALKPLRNNIFKLPPWQVKKEIHDMAKHEAFHVRRRMKIVKIKEFRFESVEKTLDGRVVGWITGAAHALNYADRVAK